MGCKFSADQYAGYKWLVDNGFFIGAIFSTGETVVERGFYTIKDRFFVDFPDPYLKGNKSEHRPHYFALTDPKTGLLWMIPMSSQAEKYQGIVDMRKALGKPCDILHICKLDNGVTNAFLLADMFPVTEEYVSAEYTIAGNHMTLTSDTEAEIVLRKAKRVLNMLHRGIVFTPTQPKVLDIEKTLLAKAK